MIMLNDNTPLQLIGPLHTDFANTPPLPNGVGVDIAIRLTTREFTLSESACKTTRH
jgi:hypothetical protein